MHFYEFFSTGYKFLIYWSQYSASNAFDAAFDKFMNF